MMKTFLCAIAKNEGPYIAEWVIYHKLLGFDYIVVYDNESSDETAEVLEILSKAGLVERRPWVMPQNGAIQKWAYKAGLKSARKCSEWIAFFDIDEFLVIPGLDNIHDFLQMHPEEKAIAVHWKMFGTSHHEKRTPGLVIERFTLASRRKHPSNASVKTLARCAVIRMPNLHNHLFFEGVIYRNLEGEVIEPNKGKTEGDATHDKLRLHHYFTKSREEWERKVARGRATKPEGDKDKYRTESNFDRNNRNEERDDYLLKFVPMIKERLAALGLPTQP